MWNYRASIVVQTRALHLPNGIKWFSLKNLSGALKNIDCQQANANKLQSASSFPRLFSIQKKCNTTLLERGIQKCCFCTSEKRKIGFFQKKLGVDQHIVIIGGGYAGTRVAKEIKGKGKFTLIDSRDAMHHNMGSLRAAVQPGFAHKIFVPFQASLGNSFVHGKVTHIDAYNKQVFLENDDAPIQYTQLVIATGSSGPFPGKCSIDLSGSEMNKMYEDFVEEVKNATKVVIVGGGPVGVELAGEIATDYPDQKEVTIVHNTDILVSPSLLPKAKDIMSKKFAQKKISVLLNEDVVNLNELPLNKTVQRSKVKLLSGKELDADLVIQCFGLSVNNHAYKNSLGEFMNERGQLKVDGNLEVEGLDDVFAIGDCNDCDVAKLALQARAQASWTSKNLILRGNGNKLVPYSSASFQMCVPIGRDGGFSQSGNLVFGDFATRKIKSTDVFVKNVWKESGLDPPQ